MSGRVVLIDDIRSGKEHAPNCLAMEPIPCPSCGAKAVLPLDRETQLKQPDGTTLVCHPCLDGCNAGFTLEERS